MKKVIITLLSMFLIMTLGACGDEKTLTDEDGNMLKLKAYEITEDGFYVHDKKDDTFSPVLSGVDGFDGIADTEIEMVSEIKPDEYSRHIWFNNDMMKLIPKVGKNSELVIVAKSQTQMPDEYVIERYKNLGATIGVHFTFGETGNVLHVENDTCSTSMAKDIMSKKSDGLLRVHKINESKDLPISNIDTQVGMLLGLEKNKKYQVGFFDGTNYEDETFVADTIAMKAAQVTNLSAESIVTEENYFIINLPKNMESGYYYINDAGLFKYVK